MGDSFPKTAVCHIEISHITPRTRRALKDTLAVFRDACSYISDVVMERWAETSEYSDAKDRLTFVEGLIHTTKDNCALYDDFDKKFYKFPSYYRRSAINFVIGQVSSYKTRLNAYEKRRYGAISGGKKFQEKAPVFNGDATPFPTMYKKEMYEMTTDNRCVIRLKLRIRNTWDWVEVSSPNRDVKDLMEKASMGKMMSPSLVYRYHKYHLVFPIQYNAAPFAGKDLHLSERKVLSVDLGINHGAVLCVMNSSGTILKRYFDPFTSERDRMDHIINRIRKVSRESGMGNSLSAIYTKLDGIKQNYVCQLARWIADKAVENGVYGVVLENLTSIRGNKNARIHHWCKCRIRDYLRGMCLRNGIRVFSINPKNTSALAYDGSGKVSRGKYSANGKTRYNYSICTFASGKQYNCDLNAAYNIGARYFVREFLKSLDENNGSELMAKVPELSRRTDCTLSTLWKINESLSAVAA